MRFSSRKYWKSVRLFLRKILFKHQKLNYLKKLIAKLARFSNDLGIWVSKDCPIGYQFVVSARECKIDRLVKARQQLCDGPNAEKYKFCPPLRNGPKVSP